MLLFQLFEGIIYYADTLTMYREDQNNSHETLYAAAAPLRDERDPASTTTDLSMLHEEEEEILDDADANDTIPALPCTATIENKVKRLSISIGHQRTFFSIWKSRYVFLLPGRLVFAKWGKSELDAVQQGFNVLPKYSFFFHPHVQISLNGRVIALSHLTTRFQLPWLKDSVTMSMGTTSTVSLKFATAEVAADWEKQIRKECIESKISLVRRSDGNYYNEVVYSVLMNSALSGNKSLLSFILANRSESESIVNALYANFQSQSNFQNNPNVLACALDCSAKDVVDSCLLLFFKLPSLTDDKIQSIFARNNRASAEQKESIDRVQAAIKGLPSFPASSTSSTLAPIFILLHSFSEDESLRKCLLKILEHPNASSESCARSPSNFEIPNHWSKQQQWFWKLQDRCGNKVVVQDADELKLLVYSPLWIILKLLNTVQRHCRSTRIRRELFSLIPSKYILKAFNYGDVDKMGNLVPARHFIKFLIELSRDELKRTMREESFRAGVTDEFFQALLEDALKTKGGCNTVADIAKELLFNAEEFCENDFCVDYIKNIPNFSPCVLEELYKASGDLFTSDPDPCKLMVTFVLRFENCDSRSKEFRNAQIVTLTEYVTSDPVAKPKRMKMVAQILEELQIDKYVYELLSPLMKTFFPGLVSGSRISGSPEPYLADHRSSFRRVRVYSKERMGDVLIGLMITSAVARSNSFAQLLSMEKDIIKTFLAPNTQFRKTTIKLLSKYYDFSDYFLDAMNANQVLNDCRHFRHDALDLMTSRNVADKELFAKVATVALKLEDYENLKIRVDKVLDNLVISREKKVPVMKNILAAVNDRKQEELGKVSIEDLSLCVNDAINAIDVLGLNQENERSKLKKLFDHYLHKCAPPSWRESFKGSFSIAIFLKYLSYDDIKEAYKVFRERNAENPKFLSLLENVCKIYRNPLITDTEVDHVLNTGTTEEAIASFLDDLDLRLQRALSTSEEKLIAKMGVEWMKKINRIMKVPIAPRNAQFITTLACCKWARGVCANKRDSERALVAQVGTGEGKSLIIAMSAIYMVKELRKRVHVLENNEGLLNKDYSQFKDFYETFGIKMADGTKTPKADIGTYDVVYTLRRDLESYYRDSVFKGVAPFENTILIVDEVDELIVDDNPNSSYVKAADSSSIAAAFEALKSGATNRPSNVSADLWREASDAKRHAKLKQKRKDYVITSDGEVTIYENGKPTHYYALWAEYIAFIECGKSPAYQTRFFYQSMPYMLLQYECILGLSGSLGSPAERNYLKSTYGAWNYNVPSFLDTCRQMRPGIPNKHLPTLVDGAVYIYDSKNKQYQAIADLAVEKATNVPVLIIVPYTAKEDMINLLLRNVRMKKGSKWLGGNPPEEFVQRFAQFDDHQNKMDWAQLIDKATAALPNTKSRRITVTDPFGGRGHDFCVRDDREHVEAHGGMLVITTFIPESERDWIQWKGRTARSDNKGQYAVMIRRDPLDKSDPEKLKDPAFLSTFGSGETRYNPSIIVELLGIQDKKKEAKIQEDEGTIAKGKRLNELCDQYYLTHKTGLAGRWPSCPNDEILCSFLESGDGSAQAVQEVSRKLGLSYRSKF